MMAVIADSTIALRILWFHVTLLHGQSTPTLLALALIAVAVIIPAWAIGNAVGTPSGTFTAIGRSKGKWIGWMVALFLFGDFLSLLVAVYYLMRVRPQIRRALVTNSA
jgi:hypothetical protein